MNVNLPLVRTIAVASVALVALSACEQVEEVIRAKSRFDSSVSASFDTGNFTNLSDGGSSRPGDVGLGTCGPTECAPFELVTEWPECACAGVCQPGYVYNLETRRCDPVDGGAGPRDTGVPLPDTGGQLDAGSPISCQVASDCPGGAFALCLAPTGTACAGENDCECFRVCDWAVPPGQSGCLAGEGCSFFGLPIAEGLCVPDQGGGVQDQACTAVFSNGNYVGDDCNGAQSFFCLDATPQDPTGSCIRLCRASNDQVCSTLGEYVCEAIPNSGGLGLCQPDSSDLGRRCPPAQCQNGFCSSDLGGLCSVACSGVNSTCPPGAVCVNGTNDGDLCAIECTPGPAGNAACAQIEPGTTCFSLGTFGVCVVP